MPIVSNVLIVGGGIAGMTLGIGLKRAGIDVEIVEKTLHWTVPGMGISLQGPALRALRTVDLLDQCIGQGFGYSCVKTCDADGNVIATAKLASLNGPDYPATIGIKRQSLHSVLMQAVAATKMPVRLGVSVTSLNQSHDRVSIQFDDGLEGIYDFVVGADGTNSIIRDLAFGTDYQPAYTGQAVWRAMVSRPPEVQCRHAFEGPRTHAGINPVSEQQMYIFLHQTQRTFLRFPDDQLPALMRDQLNDFGGVLAAAREEITALDQVIYRAVTSHILPSPWHRGRVVLIGDAAHTTAPHMASGAGIAIEDSVVLASLLASASSLRDALEQFMARRYERCRMVVESAWQLGEWEKDSSAVDVDRAGLLDKSFRTLAQPI
jgi:2-polyprenyl-6-methoxyphenol hydroxylase-like FAD-dependent oxidoreductase